MFISLSIILYFFLGFKNNWFKIILDISSLKSTKEDVKLVNKVTFRKEKDQIKWIDMIMIPNSKIYLHFMLLFIYWNQNVNFISISFYFILFYVDFYFDCFWKKTKPNKTKQKTNNRCSSLKYNSIQIKSNIHQM